MLKNKVLQILFSPIFKAKLLLRQSYFIKMIKCLKGQHFNRFNILIVRQILFSIHHWELVIMLTQLFANNKSV
jgi:hypothetical protein